MQTTPLFYINATRVYRLMPANLFINSQGTVDTHSALSANVSPELLAEAKHVWIVTHTEASCEGAQEILKRMLTYQDRITESNTCRLKCEIGSRESQYYFYRGDYYLELVQNLRNWLAGIVNEGFKARIKTNTL